MRNRVWFITGVSRGFGHIWSRAALERGTFTMALISQRCMGMLSYLSSSTSVTAKPILRQSTRPIATLGGLTWP